MYKTLIIDDESKARKTIKQLVEIHCPYIKIVGEADGVSNGLKAIRLHQPDIVLLDIHMRDGSGFELLKQVGSLNFHLIFITAYDQYAIQAFKFSALDYILKPIDPDDLMHAFGKVNDMNKNIHVQLRNFLESHESSGPGDKKIVLKTFDKIHIVKVAEIIRCESHQGYTKFFVSGGSKIMVSKTLNEYFKLLQAHDFIKVHKTHIVNMHHIERFEKRSNALVMNDGSSVPVAMRRREHLLNWIETL